MAAMLAKVLILTLVAAVAVDPNFPDRRQTLPKYTIDLDLPPEKRFVQVATDYKKGWNVLLPILKPLLYIHPGKTVIDGLVASFKKGLQTEYAQELQGIASTMDIAYDDVLMASLVYEITSVNTSVPQGPIQKILARACTSVVAQNSNGTMYLARNMDGPPPFAGLQIDATFVRAGKKVYEGTMLAGTGGLVTGLTPGGFAVSIDARSKFAPTPKEAQASLEAGGLLFFMSTRMAMEKAATDFNAAVQFFMEQPMVIPGYAALAGSKAGQGAIVTTNTSAHGNNVWYLKDGYGGSASHSAWLLVATNYDHWEAPPTHDDRRDKAKAGILALGEDRVALQGLWDVLSTPAPNGPIPASWHPQGGTYNLFTMQTSLATPADGEYYTYLRNCWAWWKGACDLKNSTAEVDAAVESPSLKDLFSLIV